MFVKYFKAKITFSLLRYNSCNKLQQLIHKNHRKRTNNDSKPVKN